MGFIVFPFSVILLGLSVYLLFFGLRSKINAFVVSLTFLVLTETVIQYSYFIGESKKITIVLINFSQETLYDIEIFGRSVREFREMIIDGDSVNFICNC